MKKNCTLLILFFMCASLRAQQVFLYQPLASAVVADTHVLLSWKKRPDVNTYTVQLSTDSIFSAPTEYLTQNAQFNLTNLIQPQVYWWRVKGDNGPWSIQRRFRCINLNSISGLSLWFRADSMVTVSNGLVSQWKDLSDSGRVALQQVTSLQPEYIVSAYNDLPAVKFGKQGTAGQFTSLLFSPMSFANGTFTAFAVWRIFTNTIALQYLVGGTNQGIYAGGSFAGFTNSGSFDGVRNYGATGTNNLLLNQTSIKKNTVWRNSTLLAGAGTPIQSLTVSQLGSRVDLPSLFLHASVPEIIIFNSDVADSSRTTVQTYLSTKYARPAKLPHDTVACNPSIFISVPGNADEFSSVLWSTGSTALGININANGTYWVRVTSRFGPITTDTIRVRGILPQPVLSPPVDQNICLRRDSVTFSNVSANTNFNFIWSTGEQTQTIKVTDNHSVFLTALDTASGCILYSDTVVVRNKIRADFANPPACPGVDAQLIDLSVDALGDTVNSWFWNFGDPNTFADVSTDSLGVWNYANSGIYPVFFKVGSSDGCADSIVKNLVVKPSALPNFTWQGLCYGKTTQFFDQSIPESGTQVTGYNWNFGPGINSSFVNPAVSFDTANIYPVTLTVNTASGCSETIVQQVPVNKGVLADFSISDTLCAGQPVNAIDLSTGVNDIVNGWVWRFGSNTPVLGQAPSFAFQNTGVRVVRLTVTTAAGCADSVQKTVFVNPSPSAVFSLNQQGGNPPFSPSVNNQSLGADSYVWTIGSFSDSGFEPVFPSYSDTGTYGIMLAVQNEEGCSDSISRNFIVFTGNRSLELFEADCIPENGFMDYSARILNKGALEISNILLEANTGYNEVIQETWSGTLMPGQILNYPFASSTKLFTQDEFCCVRIVSFNDSLLVAPSDSKICLPLSDDVWFSASYPSPVDAVFKINYTLPFAGTLSAKLYSIDGKLIRNVLEQQPVFSGFGTLNADISDLKSGVYVLSILYRDSAYSVKVVKR